MSRLSVCVITENEPFEARRFLANVEPVADEILIVDGGSRDGRRALLAAHPKVRIVERPFDNFTDQKNFAFSQARGKWILMLDTDELLSDPLRAALPKLTRAWFVSYWKILRRWLVSLDPPRFVSCESLGRDYEIRLFRNQPRFRFPAHMPVHHMFDTQALGWGRKFRGGSILHLDFVHNDRAAREAKVARYASMDPASHALGLNRGYLFEDEPHELLPLDEPCQALALR